MEPICSEAELQEFHPTRQMLGLAQQLVSQPLLSRVELNCLILEDASFESFDSLALRVGSTFLTIGSVVAVPVVLSLVPLYKILLGCAACGYFLAALVRVPMMFGKPRAVAIVMQGYDYFIGGLLIGLCSLLSLFQFCRALQTKSLLSAVFERRVAHNEIMRLLETGGTRT